MKNFFYTTLLTFSALAAGAQPVLQQANMAPINTNATLYGGPLLSPGSAGANQTWDFSSTAFVLAGTAVVLDPSTMFSSQFPTANYAYRLNIGANVVFVIYNLTSTLMEFVANGVDVGGNGGDDYSPNPKSDLEFPYNFNDVVQDTWERTDLVSGSTTRTYDAYGTLITPYGTFTNVVRQASTSGGGPMYYTWFTTNPILPVLTLNPENNSSMIILADPTGTADLSTSDDHTLFPNPAKSFTVVDNIATVSKVEMFDVVGRNVMQQTKPNTGLLDLSNVHAGLYNVRITDQSGNVGVKKLVVQ